MVALIIFDNIAVNCSYVLRLITKSGWRSVLVAHICRHIYR